MRLDEDKIDNLRRQINIKSGASHAFSSTNGRAYSTLDMPAEKANEIKAVEKAYSQELQRQGKWRHIWRITGQYSNISIFDVESNEELHNILQGLPLYPYIGY